MLRLSGKGPEISGLASLFEGISGLLAAIGHLMGKGR
jgi:hypothetical protein